MSMAAERTTLLAAVTGFAVALLLDVLLRRRGKPSWPAVSGILSVVLALLTLAVAGRWLRESQGPFLTLYDVLLSNLFSLTLVYLLAAWLVPALRASSSIVVAFLGVLGAWSLTVSAEAVPLPATFDNPWLWLHVTAGKLFLGLCLPAAATALWLLARRKAVPAEGGELDAAVWLTLSLAFVCHSFMLIAGAIWAHSAWGRYWAWDSLETWTFITWLCIALLLHARVTFRRMPVSYGWSAVVAIFGLAVLTFLGVPFLSVAPHKGVM
jgi:ABC-type transport system involved in cytochrome c biogenesis permease subunit